MKKFLTSLFLSFLIILICNISNASNSDPIYEPFEAYVSNPDGAECTEGIDPLETATLINLNYNTTINVLEEYEENGVLYGIFFNEDGKKCSIKIDDLKSTDKIYTNINNEEFKQIVIINSNGVSLRKGPSNNYYSEIEIIPEGTTLKGFPAKDYESTIKWLYVEYNGKAGWIDCLNGNVGYKYIDNRNIMLVEEINIYSDYEMTSAIDKIRPNKIINTEDMISIDFSNFFKTPDVKKGFNIDDDGIMKENYINYNGKKGYITLKNYGIENSGTYKVDSDGIALYKEPNDNSKILVSNIPVGTVLDYTYRSEMIHPGGTKFSYGFWAYTDYKGKKGWVQAVEQELLESQKEVIETINSRSDESQNGTLKIVVIAVLSVILVAAIIVLTNRLKKYNLGKR